MTTRVTSLSLGSVTIALSFTSVCWSAVLPICISASELADQFTYDKSAAATRFKGKTLVVKGVVADGSRPKRTEVDLKGNYSFLVRASGSDFGLLRQGQPVLLKCRGEGTFSPITLSSCSLVSPETACTSEPRTPSQVVSAHSVQLTLTPKLQGQSLIISGTTNLKDGALLNYEVEHALFGHQASANNWSKDGDMIVTAGHYSANVNVEGWSPGNISVWVGFQTFVRGQPEWVKNLYGEGGQKMEGPLVKPVDQGIKRAELERIVLKP
jgi:hypothetical protein